MGYESYGNKLLGKCMERAVIAIVKGGLGNQLFIYAAARAFALRAGRNLYLDTMRGFMADNYQRSYRLDRFPIKAEMMPEMWRVAPHLRHFKHKCTRTINKFFPLNYRSYLAENLSLSSRQLTSLNPVRRLITLNGYWQSESFFAAVAQTIRREVAPRAPEDKRNLTLGAELSSQASVFLHVRRVRYPQLLNCGYYQNAIDAACYQAKAKRFLIFGDDTQWALSQLNFNGRLTEAITHNGGDEMADFWLMSCCRHAIVANSSFSWWAAWVGGEPSKGRHVWFPEHAGLQLQPANGWHILPSALHRP
jgi:hypothetical protein